MRNLQTILLMAMVAVNAAAYQAQGTNRRADVNQDSEVDAGDVNAILSAILEPTDGIVALDVNDDGSVDVGDVNAVLDLILFPEPFHDPAEYVSGTLPVLHIDTKGYHTINSKERYWDGTYWLDPMGDPNVTAFGSEQEPLKLQIKGRGNTTWTSHEKKPYRLKLADKKALMGMSASKHFVLMAHINDGNELYKDEIGFEFSRRIGLPYTVAQQPVEVILNGDYIGLYDLCEKIRVDKDHVDIEEQKDKETDLEKVSGGWLMEIDNYWWENEYIALPDKNGTTLYVSFQSPEVLSDVQLDYITAFLTKLHNAVNCDDKSDNTWETYIDKESLAKFYIVNEIMDNTESFSGSCYFYKGRGEEAKVMFGPVWDFGSAAGGEWLDRGEKFIYQDAPAYVTNHWIEELAKFPSFMDCVKQQWRALEMSGGLDFDDYLDAWVSRIKVACDSEYKRWPEDSQANNIYYNKLLFSQTINRKINFLRQQWSQEPAD